MKYHLTTIFIAINFALSAQIDLPAGTGKGAVPLAQSKIQNPKSSITRAVVIGISDYQEKDIPDLRFAGKDAEAFANFLRSPAGGSLTNEQIKLLVNSKATAAQVITAFDWLFTYSQKGDRAIIYFSGYSDSDRQTKSGQGHLLCYDATAAIYMAGGSFNLWYLQDIIATLSSEGVQVWMLFDACRAGKLPGGKENGPQFVSEMLFRQYANEIKILSCQPNEYSLEGESRGLGRAEVTVYFHTICCAGCMGWPTKMVTWK